MGSLWAGSAQAAFNHEVLRRVVVFPIKTPSTYAKVAEDSWWEIREILTENKRFLIASKSFMVKRDVYQPRGALKMADAIILGQLLDSNALVTTWLDDRALKMAVYDTAYGQPLWQHEVMLHQSLPIEEQFSASAKRLVYDFLASVPYQGYVTVDSFIGKAVYVEQGRTFTQVNLGFNSGVELGDEVQFISLTGSLERPLFGDGGHIEVFAEGRVLKINRDLVTVEISRVTDINQVVKNTLVRLPKERERLREMYAIQDPLKKSISAEYLSLEMSPLKQYEAEKKPLVAAITFIANLAAFILLAF